MRDFKYSLLLVSAISLAACQSAPTVYHDKHTAQSIVYGSKFNANDGLLSSVIAQPFYIPSKNLWGIETLYMGTEWLFISEASSLGKRFSYKKSAQDVRGCSAGSCTISENGAILLSEAEFRRAAQSGFEFSLRGSKGSIDGKLPASTFQGVLKLAGK